MSIEAAKTRQEALHSNNVVHNKREIRETMTIDPELYHGARIANEAEMGGGNIWDEPEYRNDMARKHPELCSQVERPPVINGFTPGAKPEEPRSCSQPRNRFGKIKTRVVVRNGKLVEYNFEEPKPQTSNLEHQTIGAPLR